MIKKKEEPVYPKRIEYKAVPMPKPPTEAHKPLNLAKLRGANKEELVATKERILARMKYARDVKEYSEKAMRAVNIAAERDDEIRAMRITAGIPLEW